MNLKKILLFCLFAGVFCACNQGREAGTEITVTVVGLVTPAVTPETSGLPENTKMPSMTEKPENTPTEGMHPAIIMVPIDEEHFTNAVFRRFLSVKYDKDKDGFLSQSEREVIKEMEWDPYEMVREGIGTDHDEVAEATLDGFEYFPYLEDLNVVNAGEVIFKNHPSIRYVGGTEGGIGLLYMENCPSLERIGGYAYSGNVSVINCGNLKSFGVRNSDFESLSFSACPQLVLDFEEWNSVTGLSLDADAVLTALPYGLYTFKKDGYPELPGLSFETIEWENVAEQALEMPEGEDFFIRNFDKDDFSYMGIQVLEKIENCYDEQGRKGWNICIDRKTDAYSKTTFSLYTETNPEPEQIFVHPVGLEEAEVLEYSPNHGGSFHIIWELEAVYADNSGEIVLGTMTDDQYWTITSDGTKTRYRSEWEWKKNGSRQYQTEKQLYGEADRVQEET